MYIYTYKMSLDRWLEVFQRWISLFSVVTKWKPEITKSSSGVFLFSLNILKMSVSSSVKSLSWWWRMETGDNKAIREVTSAGKIENILLTDKVFFVWIFCKYYLSSSRYCFSTWCRKWCTRPPRKDLKPFLFLLYGNPCNLIEAQFSQNFIHIWVVQSVHFPLI